MREIVTGTTELPLAYMIDKSKIYFYPFLHNLI